MELKVNEVQLPEKISFNYEELKQELTEKVHLYETVVYDESQVKEAKADKARLNALKKSLNDERIRREKEYMVPFNDFKAKVNEIIGIIDKPIAIIDSQVKAYDEKRREEKRAEIQAYFDSLENPVEFITLDRIFEDGWLNATTSMKSIQESIDNTLSRIAVEVATLKELPEFSFEAVEEYKRTLDMGKAVSEGKRLADIQRRKAEAVAEARAKAEAETLKAEPVKEEPIPFTDPEEFVPETRNWIKFKAYLTVTEAHKLRQFFEDNNIKFEAL